jgi:NADPH-dependent curcumin reductase CurA
VSDTPTLPAVSREWHLLSRPEGWPKPENFALVEAEVRQPDEGQVLVRNEYLSVDPYMRGRMSAAKSYVEPFELGKAMQGGAVGEVVASRAEGIAVGDHVLHFGGWREYAVVRAENAVKVDPQAAPLSAYLGVLGMPGLTAYAGLLRVASFKEGDAVFVSGAAGAVGSQVGQIARLKGASRVIGSAGSDEKVELLVDEYGFDAAFNYKNGPVWQQLKQAAPDGIDVYFDNVGGDHLEAAIGALNLRGRVAVCGMISQYNETEPVPGPRNMVKILQNRLRVEGFIVGDHYDLQPQFVQEVGAWIRSGELKYRETVVEGVENTLEAFLGVLRGDNIGKMVVRL